MKYCSECGVPIARRSIAEEQRERYVCLKCGVTHYENPRVVVACILCCNGKILLCRRAQEPAQGQWTIPGGFLECGETLEACCARETFEETGIAIDPESLDLYSVINMTTTNQVLVNFRVQIATEPALYPGPECLELAFLAPDEAPPGQLAWVKALSYSHPRLLNEVRTGQFGIYLMTMGNAEGVGFRSRDYALAPSIK